MEKSINDIADLLYRNTNITSGETKITQNQSLLSIYGKFEYIIFLNQRTGSISVSTMNDNKIVSLPNDNNGRDLSELVRLFKYSPLVLKTIEALSTNIYYGYEYIDSDYDVVFGYDIDRGIYVSDVDISMRDLSKDFQLWSNLHTELSPNHGLLVGPTIYQYVENTVVKSSGLETCDTIPINYIKPTGQFYMSEEYIMKKIDEYYNKIKDKNFSI